VRGHHAFEACVEQLATLIRLGVYPRGSVLPSERELSDRLAVSRATLREAMAALPETLRTAVLLRDIRELSYQEIAETLQLPEGTVKSRINRGRTELARQIKRLKTQYEEAAGSRGTPGGSGGPDGHRSGVSG